MRHTTASLSLQACASASSASRLKPVTQRTRPQREVSRRLAARMRCRSRSGVPPHACEPSAGEREERRGNVGGDFQ